MSTIRSGLLIVAAIFLTSPRIAPAITLGQIDTFENGTVLGWSAVGIQNLFGGPGGTTDRFLQMAQTGGSVPTVRFVNGSQWAGNYLAAGVSGIELDLINKSSFAMPIEIRFSGFPVGSSFRSRTQFNLPPDGQWHHAIFPLTAESMIPSLSPPSLPFSSVITNVFDLAINAQTVLASFGIDNVRAVPEPSTILLAAPAALALVWYRRRRTS